MAEGIGAGGEERPARPVMADVARLAGVSHQTVSRVVNEHPYVRERTRATVLAAMAELGYRPNLTARALARRQSDTIGVIAFDTTLHGPASTLFSLEQAARTAGYEVHVVTVPDPEPQAFADAVERLVAQSVCGVVVLAPQQAAVQVMTGLPADLPAVAVEGGAAPGVPSVVVDQVAGARQATRHLLELGHREIAHVRGPRDWIEAEARVDGWGRALAEAGLVVRDPLPGDWSARSGYTAGQALCRDHLEVTGVFVANDHMALGLLRALAEAGVDVPGQVSVVGFDDIAEAEYLHPPLTTVHQDFAEVGRRCVDVLLARMAGETAPAPVVVPTRLVVRTSTGPARA